MKAKAGQSFPNYKEEKSMRITRKMPRISQCIRGSQFGDRQKQIHDRNGNLMIQQKIANRETRVLEIHLEDLEEYFKYRPY